MKNFATYISKKTIANIIKAHDSFLGNAIEDDFLKELQTLEEEYLPNLRCSDGLKSFIDEFLTDVKKLKNTGEGSNYASEFVELEK